MGIASVSQRALALGVSMCLLAIPAPAENNLHLRWNELAPLITGKRVWLRLNDGVRITGAVQAVDAAGLKVQVTKTSDQKSYPKGVLSIPRSSISTIQLNKPAGHKGLIIGGAAGTGIGVTAGVILAAIRKNEGGTSGNGIIAAAILGPIAVGLLLGWVADSLAHQGGKRITVIPD